MDPAKENASSSLSATASPPLLPRSREIAIVFFVLLASVLCAMTYVFQPSERPRFVGMFDQWAFIGPSQFFLDASIHSGDFPLWNPLIFCGTPFAADPQMQVFYPPNLLRSILTIHPTPLRTHLGLFILALLHMLLAGMGLFCLTRYQGIGRAPALCGAFVFILSSGYVQLSLANPIYVTALAWLPWLILISAAALREKDTRRFVRFAIAAGFFVAMVLVSGHPQFAVYSMFAFFGATFLLALVSHGRDLIQRGKPAVRLISFYAISLSTGAGMSSVLIIPAAELISLSSRAKGSGIQPEPHLSLHWANLQSVIDFLLSYPVGTGAASLVLAVAGVFAGSKRLLAPYCFMVYLFLDLAAGPPLPVSLVLTSLVPGEMSSYVYALVFLPFPVAALAAIGLNAFGQSQVRTKVSWALFISTLMLVVVSAVFPVTRRAIYDPLDYAEAGFDVLTVAVLCTLGFILLASRRVSFRPWMMRASVALVAMELLVQCYWQIPRTYRVAGNPYSATELSKPAYFGSNHGRITFANAAPWLENKAMYTLDSAIGGYNGLIIAPLYRAISTSNDENKYQRYIDSDCLLTNNRWNLLLKRKFWLVPSYVLGYLPSKDTLYAPTAAAFLSAPTTAVQQIDKDTILFCATSARTKMTSIDATVLQREIAAGRTSSPASELRLNFPAISISPLHAAIRIRYKSDCSASLNAWITNAATGIESKLGSASISPSPEQESVTELPLPDVEKFDLHLSFEKKDAEGSVDLQGIDIASDLMDEGALGAIKECRPNRITIDLHSLPRNRLLVLTQPRYPGWQCRLDGAPVSLLTADDCFVAVPLTPGNHRVSFVFRPVSLYIGAFVSIVTIAVSLLALVCTGQRFPARFRKKRELDHAYTFN